MKITKTLAKEISTNRLLGNLNIVVALPCEAKPLVGYYRLKKQLAITNFAVYTNTDKNIHLIVSGVGKIKSAAAVSFLQQYTSNHSYSCFCNVGIAGSQLHTIGELCIANKITDYSSQQNSYPFNVVLSITASKNSIQAKQVPLVTTDIIQENYPTNSMLDMEAFGFFQAANLFVTKEQIHVIKIISDKDATSRKQINAKFVTEIISQQLSNIDNILQAQLTLSRQEQSIQQSSHYFDSFLQNWHFSSFQQQQLTAYLRRFEILFDDKDPYELCKEFNSSKQILGYLDETIEKY